MKLLWSCVAVTMVPVWGQIINELPSREFGQVKLFTPVTSDAPNLVEGREFYGPSSIAFDYKSSIVYVADTLNSRVLAWRESSLAAGKPADKVIGQRDLYSTFQQGPFRDLATGLTLPTSVAVDANGNLYVLDWGNNRILRYPSPLEQTGDLLQVDLVIGQQSVSSGNAPNEGKAAPTLQTLSFTSTTLLRGGIAIDSSGGLWVTDTGNNRVLHYTNLSGSEPSADQAVLGQADGRVPDCSPKPNCRDTKSVLNQPISLAFDDNNALYVADGLARVLYFDQPTSQLQAKVILGIEPTPLAGQAAKPKPNDYSLGNGFQNAPLSVYTIGTDVLVSDLVANRVVRYFSASQFTPTDSAPSPQIQTVLGQPDKFSGKANRGQAEPDATTLSSPQGGAFNRQTGLLWIADYANNRVLAFPSGESTATSVLGQTNFNYNSANLIEGREIWMFGPNNACLPSGPLTSACGGIVVDRNSDPPHLYIADSLNNRILGFRDARVVGTDANTILTTKADIVIGQPDLFRSMVNYPIGDPQQPPNNTGLFRPIGLAVDDSGNLWVADSGNGRVLRFPAPFSQTSQCASSVAQCANLVLGQASLTAIKEPSASNATMNTPFGLALFFDDKPAGSRQITSLAVSDAVHNRVLVFHKPAGGDFTSGQAADRVLGQQSFSGSGPSSTAAGLNSPRHVAADANGRLYVSDAGNNRLVVYKNDAPTGDAAPFRETFSQPQGVTVTANYEIWLTASNAIYHLPDIQTYDNTLAPLQQIPTSATPLAVALDSFDNLITADVTNRINFYFAKLVYRHPGSFASAQPVAPGMMLLVARQDGRAVFPSFPRVAPPYPKLAAGLQALVNGVPSPIFQVDPSLIYMVVPMGASPGYNEFLITRPATGEILSSGNFFVGAAAPGFFTSNSQGTGQVAATNFDDGTVNGPQNPVSRGKIITVWLTGQGFVSNAPPDGEGAAGPISTPDWPVVFLNAASIPHDACTSASGCVLYSGLTVYPGAWVLNIRLPDDTNGPGCAGAVASCGIPIFVSMKEAGSNVGGTSTIGQDQKPILTTIQVKK